jgi:16S rRNA processing protein RimM
VKERDLVLVGKILKEFGLKGEVKVSSLIEPLDDFLALKKFYVFLKNGGKKTLKVVNQRSGGGHTLIIKFDGIDSRDLAEELRGMELYVEKENLAPSGEGEYYFFELEGLDVRDEKRGKIGKLTYIHKYPAQDVFEITDEKGKEILIPAVSEFIRKIDIEGGEIIVNLPEGLIEEENSP